MARLPRVSGADLIRLLERRGYVRIRIVGSHVRLKHPQLPPTTVPLHDVIGPALLRKIMRDTGLTLPDLFDE